MFAAAIALALPAAYVLLGAGLADHEDRRRAAEEGGANGRRIAWAPMVVGLVLISMATPLDQRDGARALVRAAARSSRCWRFRS